MSSQNYIFRTKSFPEALVQVLLSASIFRVFIIPTLVWICLLSGNLSIPQLYSPNGLEWNTLQIPLLTFSRL